MGLSSLYCDWLEQIAFPYVREIKYKISRGRLLDSKQKKQFIPNNLCKEAATKLNCNNRESEVPPQETDPAPPWKIRCLRVKMKSLLYLVAFYLWWLILGGSRGRETGEEEKARKILVSLIF